MQIIPSSNELFAAGVELYATRPDKDCAVYRRNKHEIIPRSAARKELWRDVYSAELLEMLIESKRPFDAKLFHQHLARAIGKAPFFVGECLKDVPRLSQLRLGQIMNGGDGSAEELPTKRVRVSAHRELLAMSASRLQ